MIAGGKDKPHVCFVAHNAYGAVTGADTGHVGGIERQTALMARWLADRGYEVSLVTWDHGQPDGDSVQGLRTWKLCRRDAGVPGLRFLHPRWTSLNRALRRADSDVYFYSCGDMGLGQIVHWCRRHRRRCVFSVASEPDCDPALPVLKPLRERVLYRYGLEHADRVIVQTLRQQRMLADGFGMTSCVLPMPCGDPDDGAFIPPSAPNDNDASVLWVGRFSPEKRFDWLLELARLLPAVRFDVVGAANYGDPLQAELAGRAETLPNVKLHGRVAHEEMPRFYRSAGVLCCTSSYEGFPNTFLEAWSCGLPVVTTFDPDGLVEARGLGWVASDVDALASAVRGAFSETDRWREASLAGREYFLANHELNAAMARFAAVLDEVAND